MGKSDTVLERELKILEVLDKAASADFGVEVETDNLQNCKADIVKMRKSNKRWEDIVIVTPPGGSTTKLWLMKKAPDDETETS